MTEQELHKIQSDQETRLRGSVMVVSVVIESILLLVVYYSNAAQWVKPVESKSLKLKNLTFGGKVKRTICLMLDHHQDLLIKYSALFSDLKSFVDIRNKLAHSAIRWLDERCEYLEIFEVKEAPNKFQYYAETKHRYDELAHYISTVFSKIVTPLTSLQSEVEYRLSQNDPALYAELSLVLGSDLGK